MFANIMSPQIISLISAIGIFLITVFIAVIKDEIDNKNARNKRPDNEWLFSRWDEKLYDALFSKTPPEKMLKSLGVELEDYIKDCNVLNAEKIPLKKLAADKIIGIFVMFVGLFVLLVSGVKGIFIFAIFLALGYLLYEGDVKKIHKKATEKRNKLENELPRFLDLLQTALYVNMPVSESIIVTSKYLKNTIISEELMKSMADSTLGTVSWQKSLQDVAIKYEVDVFSDFVQYLITGYEKGLPIYDVVKRQSEEVKRVTTFKAEEKANKINSSILIPIAIYKLFPMLLLAMYPILLQLLGGNLM